MMYRQPLHIAMQRLLRVGGWGQHLPIDHQVSAIATCMTTTASRRIRHVNRGMFRDSLICSKAVSEVCLMMYECSAFRWVLIY